MTQARSAFRLSIKPCVAVLLEVLNSGSHADLIKRQLFLSAFYVSVVVQQRIKDSSM